jgi:F-type H+-transporting ATPase subunit delta
MKLRSTKTLAQAIYETTKGKSGVELTSALEKTLLFLDKNQLLGKSKEILSQLEKIIDIEEKVLRAKVRSADVLSKKMIDELQESLKKRYRAKTVEIDSTVDAKLINGLKIEVNDEIIDLTLSNRLHQLQTHLIKN